MRFQRLTGLRGSGSEMTYITTYTGRRINPLEADEDMIDIRDVAHSLSLMCRANGHSRYFFSVAQHSINCAKEAVERGLDARTVLFCLLHDGSEAYLSDVTRPVKKELDYYLKAEKELQDAIYKRFAGRVPDSREARDVLQMDNLMLSLEFHEYMPEDINGDYRKIRSSVSCAYEEPDRVEKEFLAIFDMLTGLVFGREK